MGYDSLVTETIITATIGSGYYRATATALTRVIELYLPATTDQLRTSVDERSQCDHSGLNMAELLIILADFETAAMGNEAFARKAGNIRD